MKATSKIKEVKKGWGYELWFHNDEKYCGKLLYFNKGKKCSWHVHKLKTETFYIQSGEIEVTYGLTDDISKANKIILVPGDTFEVAVGLRHRMRAIDDTELFEFSTQHWDEDSVVIEKGDQLKE